MRILITGGTGLIGQYLCRALLAEGHILTVLSRHPETVAVKCGAAVRPMATLDEWRADRTFDAVINLAGEPIVDNYWSAKRKQLLRASRIALTETLVQRIAAAKQKPSVLLSGSAVGFYGNGGDKELYESVSSGNDFAANLCRDWEFAALAAKPSGVRVCLLRTGLVLSNSGGLLGKMRLPFKLGMGARLGSGRQWMSWVHIEDYVAMVLRLLQDEQLSGPFNMAAPNPVNNAEFTRVLARTLHRPAVFVAPDFMLRLLMGERAALMLEGQRALPANLMDAGYQFQYPNLANALDNLLHH
jgi:uncharacterized protein (TIGR01777 family)